MAKRELKTNNIEKELKETVEPETCEDAAPVVVKGIVSNCSRLNIRKKPSKNADVLCEVKAKSEVIVFEDSVSKKWLHVITDNGVEGYCMKEFVTINQ